MKKVLPWLSAVSGAFVGWCIGKGIGEALYSAYKETGDMVTASENISLHHIMPIIFGIVLAWLCYRFTESE